MGQANAQAGTGDFRIVPSAPNYSVSEKGRVYRRARTMIRNPKTGAKMRLKGCFLIPTITTHSLRHQVTIGGLTRNVGSVVLEAFVGPRPKGLVCCHLNGDTVDNRLENLKWGTRAESGAGRPKRKAA